MKKTDNYMAKKVGILIGVLAFLLIKKKIMPILKKNKVVRAGIFGSYARGEQKKNSDVDILVEIKKRISLFDFAGIKVDLVEYKIIKPRIRENILNSEVRII